MKDGIHPAYPLTVVHGDCGESFEARSTAGGDMHVEVCSACHPFYTGQQRAHSSGGRIERFQRKLEQARAANR